MGKEKTPSVSKVVENVAEGAAAVAFVTTCAVVGGSLGVAKAAGEAVVHSITEAGKGEKSKDST